MKHLLILLVLLGSSCSILKKSQQEIRINKMTFTVTSTFDKMSEMAGQIESYIENVDSTGVSDSFSIKFQKLMQSKLEEEAKFPNEIYIKPNLNGWERQRYFNNRYTNHLVFNSDNDTITIINPERTETIGTYKLKRDSCTCKLEERKDKIKTIKGYNCYFVLLEEICGDKEYVEIIGSTIYEMWVTEEIPLSMYSILKNECEIDGLFPLETKMYQSKSRGTSHSYRIETIE